MEFRADTQSAVTVILAILYLVLILGIIMYVQNKLTLKSRRCEGLKEKVYPNLDPFVTDLPATREPLVNFYVKSAYNCCAVGLYKNSFVSLCALNACLGQGNRCLDFEIYSVDNQPVVAVSSLPDFNIKESYNSITLDKVLAHVAENGFSASACPNPGDPLFLNFRVKSDHSEVYDGMAALISKHLEDRTIGALNPKFGYANSGCSEFSCQPHNLFQMEDGPYGQNSGISFENAKGRVIIMVQGNPSVLQASKLYEYTNVEAGGGFFQILRYTHDIKHSPDPQLLIHTTKRTGVMVLPDLKASDANYNFYLGKEYGCQFMCMAVQEFDENLEAYDAFFGEAGHAFVLKPKSLRLVIQTLDEEEKVPVNTLVHAGQDIVVAPGIPLPKGPDGQSLQPKSEEDSS
jgi:hypothetical protein